MKPKIKIVKIKIVEVVAFQSNFPYPNNSLTMGPRKTRKAKKIGIKKAKI